MSWFKATSGLHRYLHREDHCCHLTPLCPYMARMHIWETFFCVSPLADLNENQLMWKTCYLKMTSFPINLSLSCFLFLSSTVWSLSQSPEKTQGESKFSQLTPMWVCPMLFNFSHSCQMAMRAFSPSLYLMGDHQRAQSGGTMFFQQYFPNIHPKCPLSTWTTSL